MGINCPLLYAVSHASFKTSNLGQANQNTVELHEIGQNDRVFVSLLGNTVSEDEA